MAGRLLGTGAAALALLLLAGCRRDPGLPPRPAEEPFALRRGRLLYREWCSGCHGAEGRGDGLGWGEGRDPRPADLAASGLERQRLEEFLHAPRPAAACPSWAKHFSPSEIADICRFILSGLPPEPP